MWNMDETGLQLEHKPWRVLAQKAVRYKRETWDVDGHSMCQCSRWPNTPTHHWKMKNDKSAAWLRCAKCTTRHNKGWPKQGITRLWFEQSFLANIGVEQPLVLNLDGHDSHNFVELVEIAMVDQTAIVQLLAHTSNWLQPCDRTVFKPCQDLMHTYQAPWLAMPTSVDCGQKRGTRLIMGICCAWKPTHLQYNWRWCGGCRQREARPWLEWWAHSTVSCCIIQSGCHSWYTTIIT